MDFSENAFAKLPPPPTSIYSIPPPSYISSTGRKRRLHHNLPAFQGLHSAYAKSREMRQNHILNVEIIEEVNYLLSL